MSTRLSNSADVGIELSPPGFWRLVCGLTLLLTFLSLFLVDLPLIPALLLAALLACYAWHAWRVLGQYRGARLYGIGERWFLATGTGPDCELVITGASVIAPSLLILNFRENQGDKSHWLLLTARQCGGDWRALRCRCVKAFSPGASVPG